MVAWKQYKVFIPRKYKDRAGDDKTHFWQIGTMIPMRDTDGFQLHLFTTLIQVPPDTALVVFRDLSKIERENKQPEDDADPADMDDIPF